MEKSDFLADLMLCGYVHYVCTFAIQSNVRGINLSKDKFGNACFLKRYYSDNQCSHNKQNFI